MVSELIGVNNNGCISQGFPEKQNQQERQREGERGDRERERGFILGTVGLYIYGSWEFP